MTDGPIQIMLVDDHSLVRDGIKSLLEDDKDLEVTSEASSGEEGLSLLQNGARDADVLVVDIRMTGMSGIEMVRRISSLGLQKKCLMLSMHDSEEYVMQSVQAGAHGYLLKDASKNEFIKAIKTVFQGEVYYSGDISKYLLKNVSSKKVTPIQQGDNRIDQEIVNQLGVTKRELEILQLVAKGMSNIEIAENLGKSKRTIESHRFNLMKKLQVKNQVELTNKGRELGLLS